MMTFILFFYFLGMAKEVSTIEIKPKQILEVRLSLGKTTLLRFDEKPQKVIIGNKNYYNLEATENDIAIQPLSRATTNLFVYLKSETYSFILKNSEGSIYDDFIVVKRKEDVINESFVPLKSNNSHQNLSKKVEFKKISFLFKRITPVGQKHVIEFDTRNLSKSEVKASDFVFEVFAKDGNSIFSESALESFYLNQGTTLGRLAFSVKAKQDIFVKVKQGKIEKTITIEKRYL